MKTYKVPVVGYALINNGKVAEVKTLSIDPNTKVNNKTLFLESGKKYLIQ